MHDRIADQGHVEDLFRGDSALGRRFVEQLPDRGTHRGGHLPLPAGVHHHVGDPAHEVLSEPDLGVHRTGRSKDRAGGEVAQMRRDRGRADVHRRPVRPVPEAGPDRDEVAPAVHRGRHLPPAGAQGRLEGPEHREIAAHVLHAPLLAQRRPDPAQIPGRLVHVGRRDLDEVQPHHGIDPDRVDLGALAHNLPVDLAVGRDVDHHVAPDPRRTTQATSGRQRRALVVVALLDRPEFGEVVGPGVDAVLGELPDALHDLAAPADPPPAAHRVEIHPQRAGRVEDLRSGREPPPPSRGREDDLRAAAPGAGAFSHGGGAGRRLAGPALPRCRGRGARGSARSSAGSPGRVPSSRPRPCRSGRRRRAGGW